MVDVVLIILATPFILPLLLIVALIASLDGKQPFYHQQRLGQGGRHFRFWKFRTMVPNADEILEKHLAENPLAAREWHVSQKLTNDPRITEFGHFLRKTSLDELPQLYNVLKGDMSLVGPRPMMPKQRKLYPGRYYEAMRPGITGLWQVSERNEVAFSERARFDKKYAREVSLAMDARVLLQTVRVVLVANGK
jgi:lipopolysaccharide/colanic/teichoic acid biosynthesis glycosyltransferase